MSSKGEKPLALKQAYIHLGITAFSLVFCAVYYIFSHGVRDVHMTLLFLPSASAALLYFLLFFFRSDVDRYAVYAFNTGFPFFWVYLCLTGVYTIAKTVSEWLIAFAIIGAVGVVVSLVFQIIFIIRTRKNKKDSASNETEKTQD